MASGYLDKAGLTYFFGKLKDLFQEKLVSGTNIKTINNESVLGSGDISISGGDSEYDFETAITATIDGRAVSTHPFIVYPVDTADVNATNLLKFKAYLKNGDAVYPLIIVYAFTTGSASFSIYVKSINKNVQSTSSSNISGKLHIVAPFEIRSVTYGK